MANRTQVEHCTQPMSEATKSKLLKKIYADNISVLTFVLKRFRFSAQDNEDLLQDIFMRFYLIMDQIDAKKARPYLLVMTKNVAIDHYRSKKFTRDTCELNEALHIPDSSAEETLRLARCQGVSDFIAKIQGDPGADLLLLFYGEGTSVKNIAAQKQEKVGTITSRLSRMRRKYKAELQQFLTSADCT